MLKAMVSGPALALAAFTASRSEQWVASQAPSSVSSVALTVKASAPAGRGSEANRSKIAIAARPMTSSRTYLITRPPSGGPPFVDGPFIRSTAPPSAHRWAARRQVHRQRRHVAQDEQRVHSVKIVVALHVALVY